METKILIADDGPLLYLTNHKSLHKLFRLGVIHLPDLVVMNIIAKDQVNTQQIRKWLLAGIPVEAIVVTETPVGENLRLARERNPFHSLPDGGERACMIWLIEQIDATSERTVIVYEDERVRRVVLDYDSTLETRLLKVEDFVAICNRKDQDFISNMP
jgi:hypothetical protein